MTGAAALPSRRLVRTASMIVPSSSLRVEPVELTGPVESGRIGAFDGAGAAVGAVAVAALVRAGAAVDV